MPPATDERYLPAGEVLATRYRIGKALGRGGTAVVHEAVDLRSGKVFAIKIMNRPASTGKKPSEPSLLMEAERAKRFTSPHAVRLYDLGVHDDGRPFVVMERLVGQDLGQRLLERGPMSVSDASEIVLQACHALAEAHRSGVVHRDIKPGNLFVSVRRDGTPHVQVLDFGLAALMADDLQSPTSTPSLTTLRVAGSPCYAAPEQVSSQRSIDGRADIWGLGVVLYELVLGRRPFEAETLIDTLIAAGSQPVPPMSSVPSAFEAVVRRCLEKDRELRFPDVTALAEALVPFAPPSLADYADLVREAAGNQAIASAESTQRVLPEDEGPTSVTSVRPNSTLGVPRSSSRAGTSSFVAQVMEGRGNPWGFFVGFLALSALARAAVLSQAHAAPSVRLPVSRPLPSASPSMLLAPLPRSSASPDHPAADEGPPGWQTDPPSSWREVP